MTTYSYTPVEINKIGATLAEAFGDMTSDGEKFVKSGNINTFIVLDAGYNQDKVEGLVDTLTLVHPCRVFLIVLDSQQKELNAEISTRCHAISKSEHVCSEVVRLTAGRENLNAVMSVVRANLITGMPSELVVKKGVAGLSTLDEFSSISEQVIFSSRSFSRDLREAEILLKTSKNLVDLEWIRLGIWRDQIKDIFGNVRWQQQNAAKISRLSISSTVADDYNGEFPVDAALMAGWIMDRLSLSIESGMGKVKILKTADGEKVELNFVTERGAAINGLPLLNGLHMDFKTASGAAVSLQLIRKDKLEAIVNAGSEFRLSRPFDDESEEGLIKRFFYIGESITNYRNSLCNAIKLSRGI